MSPPSKKCNLEEAPSSPLGSFSFGQGTNNTSIECPNNRGRRWWGGGHPSSTLTCTDSFFGIDNISRHSKEVKNLDQHKGREKGQGSDDHFGARRDSLGWVPLDHREHSEDCLSYKEQKSSREDVEDDPPILWLGGSEKMFARGEY